MDQNSMQNGMNMANPMMPSVKPMPNVAPIQSGREKESSFSALSVIGVIVACIVAAVAVVFAVQKQMLLNGLTNEIEIRKAKEISDAKAAQKEIDDKTYEEKSKSSVKSFTGPTELAMINFYYPKDWHVHIANAGSNAGSKSTGKGIEYQVFFNPEYIPPTSEKTSAYALRLEVVNKAPDAVQAELDKEVDKNHLTKQMIQTESGISGVRYDGDYEGFSMSSIVVFKVGNTGKTAIMRTDGNDNKGAFEKIVKTITETYE